MLPPLFEFVVKHASLAGTALVILCALAFIELTRWLIGTRPLSPTEVVLLMNRRKAKIVDLREASEFLKRHIPKAVSLSDTPKACIINQFQPAAPVIFISTYSSPPFKLLRQLRAAGFSELYHLEGGMEAWQRACLPTIRSPFEKQSL